MLLVKSQKYQLRGKICQQKTQNFTRMEALISENPVQKSIAIHFHPCNPALLPKNTCSILWDLCIKFICVFGGIWQCNVEIRKLKFL